MKQFLSFLIFITSFASAQVINFPDANLKAKLLSANLFNGVARNVAFDMIVIDSNADGEIDVTEAQAVGHLNLSLSNIASLEGIQFFSELRGLNVNSNMLTELTTTGLGQLLSLNCGVNLLTSLVVTSSPNLLSIDCYGNNLSELDLSGLTQLGSLYCWNNQLTSLDLSNKPQFSELAANQNQINNLNLAGSDAIITLGIAGNELTEIDLSGKSQLYLLLCSNNHLQFLDLTGLSTLHEIQAWENELTTIITTGATSMTHLQVQSNNISAIDVSGLPALYYFAIDNNAVTSLDVSSNPNLTLFGCSNNNLISMNIANGNNNSVYFASNPDLQYICADPDEVDSISMAIVENGNPMCVVSTICNGQNMYTIQGDIKVDHDSNGCTVADSTFPNLALEVLSPSGGGTIIASAQGHYSIPAGASTYEIIPVLSSTYYIIEPTSVTINLPADSGIANFCIVPNGVHHDLNISILPIMPARPGFDATYKIVCTNVGTTVASGTVTLTFPDATADFIDALPAVSSQAGGVLNWDFESLQPFALFEIIATVNINSPQETPPVNAGDVFDLTASVSTVALDETPANNTFNYSEVVTGSYDPNDKRCIEGSIVGTEMIGEFVHYLVRFENTGSAPASNIIVSDRIALDKFDLSSLVPISGSHPFKTKISDGNKVEFIFENINLPFEDEANDGYIGFKIRTLQSLAAGDEFSNSASIFFDYNFPIETNNATTVIQTLGNQDFGFADHFVLYPNPVDQILSISAHSVVVRAVEIYNMLGQLMIEKSEADLFHIDVSHLEAGNYLIRITTEKGRSTGRFIKK